MATQDCTIRRRPTEDFGELPSGLRLRVEDSRAASAAAFLVAVVTVGGCSSLPVPDPNVRYIAFGDSTTAGPAEQDYPEVLRQRLGEPPESFVNQGLGGERATDGLDRLHALLDNEVYPNAHTLMYWEGGGELIDFMKATDPLLLLSPDDSSYPFGDELDVTLADIQTTIEDAIRAGQDAELKVYVATYFGTPEAVLPCDPLLGKTILPLQAANANDYALRLNLAIRQAVSNTGATLVDVASLNGELTSDTSNYVNCNHLSSAGNAQVAALFADVITAHGDE